VEGEGAALQDENSYSPVASFVALTSTIRFIARCGTGLFEMVVEKIKSI